MTVQFDPAWQTFFLLIYGFLAWACEAAYYAIKDRRFINTGLLTLPVDFEAGVIFSCMAFFLPALERNYFGMYLLTLADLIIVHAVLGFFGGLLTRTGWHAPAGIWQGLPQCLFAAAGFLMIYLLAQPFMMLLASLIPAAALDVVAIIAWILIAADFIAVLIAEKKGPDAFERQMERGGTNKLVDKISGFVWQRLEKSYPGIRGERGREDAVFAKGMSLDKLVWVFLIMALIGDIVETFYVRLIQGEWMSRSSVIFGPFSFVWGIGAVLLTMCLMPLKDKKGWVIVLAGAFLGGAFEYMCSVFTEIVFGKVFWDYTKIPLNIGGRTNVLFMAFWGILGLMWVRLAYPALERFIERFPPIAAKISTWAIVALMVLNALLTVAVMQRYNTRQARPQPANALEEFIDETYDDEFVENRWRNMKSEMGKPALSSQTDSAR